MEVGLDLEEIFFSFLITSNEGTKIYYVIDPHREKIYATDIDKIFGAKAFRYDGVYAHPHDPLESRMLSWEEDFEVIDFKDYKQD